MRLKFLATTLLTVSIASATALAIPRFDETKPGLANETPKELEGIGIEEHRGEKIDLTLKFRNEQGEVVPLASFFEHGKPVLLSLAYYECPSLCNYHLNGLNDAFKQLKAPLGKEFHHVVVSIEPKETPAVASAKKANYVKANGKPESAEGWHFLTGEEKEIFALAKQVGFKFRWDEETKQYAHASAAIVLTPDGTISRYLNGVTFDPKTLRLSMVEASNGKVGTVIDKLTLFCFHFDPKASKYTLYASNIMRGGGAVTVLALVCFMAPFWFRKREEDRLQGEA